MAEAVSWHLPGALAWGRAPDNSLNKEGISSLCERPGVICPVSVIPSLLNVFFDIWELNPVSV
jgi:hypothetical protein